MDPNQFRRIVTPKISKYVPADHRPTPKQMVFMGLNVPEAGYGGATGGGKSDALLMDALQGVHVPGYSALLLRRTYSDLALPGALMDRAHDWFAGTNARWVDKSKSWEFPTEGRQPATLSFGFMETDKDRIRYQGSELCYVGYDECTQFSERQYTYLFSRLRYNKTLKALMDADPNLNLALKMRSGTNPGGPGHIWYKQRFITNKKTRCKIHPLYEGVDEPINDCKSCQEYHDNVWRVFVPSGLMDNPHIDHATYLKNLQFLDPVTRQQYIDGNWDVTEGGGMFMREWFTDHPDGRQHIISEKTARKFTFAKIVRYWDLAATKVNTINPDPDWTAGVLLGVAIGGEIVILDVRRIRENPGKVVQFIQETAEEDLANWGEEVIIRGEEEPGATGKFVSQDLVRDHLAGYDARFSKSNGKKWLRAKPVATAAFNGNLFLVYGQWNSDFLDELEIFNPDGEGHDDQVDACSGAFKTIVKRQNLVGGAANVDEAVQKAVQAEIAKKAPGSFLEAAAQHVSSGGTTEKLIASDAYKRAMKRAHSFDFTM